MNAALAKLYGLDKTASAEDSMDFDPNQVSVAQLWAGFEDGTYDPSDFFDFEEKTAGSVDISQLSDEELAALAAGEDEEILEKMAASGELQALDLAGRIQAHAFYDELTKLSSDESGEYDLPDEIGLDEISVADAEMLLESGEYELVDDEEEKTAMSMAQMRAAGAAVSQGVRGAGRVGRQHASVENFLRRGQGALEQRAGRHKGAVRKVGLKLRKKNVQIGGRRVGRSMKRGYSGAIAALKGK